MAEIELSRADLGGGLPDLCLCCGEPAEVWQQKSFEMSEEGPSPMGRIAVLIQLGESFFRDKVVMRAPFCRAHQHHWRRRKVIMIGSSAASLVWLVIYVWISENRGPRPDNAILFAIGVAGAILSGIVAAIAYETSVHATLVTPKSLTLKRVSDKFAQAYEQRR